MPTACCYFLQCGCSHDYLLAAAWLTPRPRYLERLFLAPEVDTSKDFGQHATKKVFASQERVSGFPEKGADLRGSPGNFRGSPGNFRGTPGLLLSATVRELPGKSPTNFRGSLGNFRGSPGTSRSSGEADPLPATRQICLQPKGLADRRDRLTGIERCDSDSSWRGVSPPPPTEQYVFNLGCLCSWYRGLAHNRHSGHVDIAVPLLDASSAV